MGRLTEGMSPLGSEIGALRNYIDDLKRNVAEMQVGFHNARDEMARSTKAERTAFVSDLKVLVAEMLSGFRNAHADMAEKTKTDRMAFVSNLKTTVTDLKTTVAGMRHEFTEDLEGARRAWSGKILSPLHTSKEVEQRSAETEAAEEASAKEIVSDGPAKEIVPDDLTELAGIGPGRMERINEAGIYTFAHLAESTPEELRRILGKLLTTEDIQKLTSQARDLASS